MQEVAGERGGYLHGRGGNNPPSLSVCVLSFLFVFTFCFFNFILFEYAALDSDDLLYLKEQMEAEEDAERLLRRTEKRAFAAFKISFYVIERGRVLVVRNETFVMFSCASFSLDLLVTNAILNLAIGYPLTWLLFHDSVKEEEDLLISV